MITEAEMPHEVMQKRVTTHKCGDCGAQLIIAWGGSLGIDSYILRCGKDIKHNTISDYKKPSKEVEEGLKIYRRIYGMDTKALMVMDKQTMLARVGQAKFPKELTKAEATLMCEVAISYGFDPIMTELMIYQGNPYVTINGRYRKAQETGQFDGIDTRPATKQERIERNAKEGDYLYRCEVWRKDASHPFVGWGRVGKKETEGNINLPIVKDPDRQCEKRAEAMGLRKAFSMPIPIHSWEEAQEAMADVDGRKVNVETGEIIEGESRDLPDEPVADQKIPTEQAKDPKYPTIEELQAFMTENSWSPKDIGDFGKEKGWEINKFGDLKPEQRGELFEHIQKNPKTLTKE